ncbi:MAG: DNA primase [Bacilli bacterium]|nr:DNA primase [Bacilli bacterium]
MSRITPEIIDEIKSKNRIEDVIRSYGVDLDSRYKALCPFHKEKTPSFSVQVEKQIFTCFGKCDFTGDVFTFVEKKEGVTRLEAIKILADRAGIKLDNNISKPKDTKYQKYYEINDVVNKYFKNNLLSKDGTKALKYLSDRSLDKDLIQEFNIGLSTNNKLNEILLKKYDENDLLTLGIIKESNGRIYDAFQNRIIFPIIDENNNVIAFSGRKYLSDDINDDTLPKYSNSKESNIFKKSSIFYNINNALPNIRINHQIVLTEGFMDTIRMVSIGYKNVVALMGTAFTRDHLEKILKWKCDVVLNLDQDGAGVENTIKIGDLLQKYNIDTTVVVFDDYKDSDEFIINKGKNAFDTVFNNRIPFIDFKLKYIRSNKNMKDSAEISKYINEAIESLNQINDDVLRELKIKEIANEFDIDESIIRNKIKINVEIKKKEVNKEEKKKKYNKYDLSEIRILYLMMNYDDVILYFENSLGYLIHDNMSNLAYKIIEFRNDRGYFDYFDFQNYIIEDEDLTNTLNEVMSVHNDKEYEESELEKCINIVKEYSVKRRIESLKKEMNETLDINKKIEIAKKIENINKEVLKW